MATEIDVGLYIRIFRLATFTICMHHENRVSTDDKESGRVRGISMYEIEHNNFCKAVGIKLIVFLDKLGVKVFLKHLDIFMTIPPTEFCFSLF